MSVSRLYLGVHSLADVVSGLVPGGLLLLIYLGVSDSIYNYISQENSCSKLNLIVIKMVNCKLEVEMGTRVPPDNSITHG